MFRAPAPFGCFLHFWHHSVCQTRAVFPAPHLESTISQGAPGPLLGNSCLQAGIRPRERVELREFHADTVTRSVSDARFAPCIVFF